MNYHKKSNIPSIQVCQTATSIFLKLCTCSISYSHCVRSLTLFSLQSCNITKVKHSINTSLSNRQYSIFSHWTCVIILTRTTSDLFSTFSHSPSITVFIYIYSMSFVCLFTYTRIYCLYVFYTN